MSGSFENRELTDFVHLKYMRWEKHILQDPGIMFGKAVIKGTRIRVELILEKLGSNFSFDEILQAYPRITREDITACLFYAANNAKHEKVIAIK